MTGLFLKSLIRHLRWWGSSFLPRNRAAAPLSLRRLLLLIAAFPVFLLIQAAHAICLLLDELLFPSYRDVQIKDPVFVIGIPRSGTTFLHRRLAADADTFTTFTTWETVLAPSIVQRKLLRLIGRADRCFGAPVRKFVDRGLSSGAGDFNNIHQIGLVAPEEDYLSLLPIGGCFIMLMAFPLSKELRQLAKLDTMPPTERDTLLGFYQSILKRHLYCHPGKKLLSKNAAFSTWAEPLRDAIPSAKFLVCVRDPLSALSSQLSSLTPARSLFGSDPNGTLTTELFCDFYTHFYQAIAQFAETSPRNRAAIIAQTDLRQDPEATTQGALRQVEVISNLITSSPARTSPRADKSQHFHKPEDFSLDRKMTERSMSPAFETIMLSENRVSPSHT